MPALVATLQSIIAKEAAFIVKFDIIAGSGTNGCLGILNADCLIEVTPESGQAPTTLRPENLTKMIGRLWPTCLRGAIWLMGLDGYAQIADASFSNGQPVVQYQGSRRFILGCELLVTEYTNPLGERGDVLLVDLGEYILADHGQSFLASMHVQYLYDESCFRFVWRIDGAPKWKSTLTPLNAQVSTSMAVTLGAHADGRITERDLGQQRHARVPQSAARLCRSAVGLSLARWIRRRRCGCSRTCRPRRTRARS